MRGVLLRRHDGDFPDLQLQQRRRSPLGKSTGVFLFSQGKGTLQVLGQIIYPYSTTLHYTYLHSDCTTLTLALPYTHLHSLYADLYVDDIFEV